MVLTESAFFYAMKKTLAIISFALLLMALIWQLLNLKDSNAKGLKEVIIAEFNAGEHIDKYQYQGNFLQHYTNNEFIPPRLDLTKSTDTIFSQNNKLYLCHYQINNNRKQSISVLSSDYLSNTYFFELLSYDKKGSEALKFGNSDFYAIYKLRLSTWFFLILLLCPIAILLLSLPKNELKAWQKQVAFLLYPGISILLLPLIQFLNPLYSSAASYAFFEGLDNLGMYLLVAANLLYAFFYARLVLKRYKTHFMLGVSVLSAVLISSLIYYSTISFSLFNLLSNQALFPVIILSIALFLGIFYSVVLADRLSWKWRLLIAFLILLIEFLLVNDWYFSIGFAIALQASLFLKKTQHKYVKYAVAFVLSLGLSLALNNKEEERKKAEFQSFANDLIDRESILQNFEFPMLIEEARLYAKDFDIPFSKTFENLFEREFLGFYNFYVLNSKDSALIEKKYIPYGIGYINLLQSEVTLEKPVKYAYYIDCRLVEEQPQGYFPNDVFELDSTDLQQLTKVGTDNYQVYYQDSESKGLENLNRWILLFLVLVASISYPALKVSSMRNRIFGISFLFGVSILGIWAYFSYWNSSKLSEQNRDKTIIEKTQSLEFEIADKLNSVRKNDLDKSYLRQILRKFSTVFFTDINLYDSKGVLMASSRPQIYEAGLVSERINPSVLDHFNASSQIFITEENLGQLNFTSTYSKLKLITGEEVYINLPFFARTRDLGSYLQTLTDLLINSFIIILILSALSALLISYGINQPLAKLSAQVKQLKLSDSNSRLDTRTEIELAPLISAYNEQVAELEKAAEELASKERQSAWKLMAKQVAHEVKNPLTPIKLNAQFMLRELNSGNLEQAKAANFLEGIITQVETLTRVVNEFSHFAEINEVKPVNIELKKFVEQLPEYSSKTDLIQINIPESLSIKVDKSHLSRILTNLIKNAYQAATSQESCRINITASSSGKQITIVVEDNGSGIPADIKDKIFEPNFSTKSTGMGLGLYMVKKLVEINGGEIRLSESQEGAVFLVQFSTT